MRRCNECQYWTSGDRCCRSFENYNDDKIKVTCNTARGSELYCGAEAKYFSTDLKLRLTVSDGYLVVYYGVNSKHNVGFIDLIGNCTMLDRYQQLMVRERWIKDGKKCSSESVEWRGKTYEIYSGILRCITDETSIYSFEACCPCVGCKDDNIVRYENKTPILF